MSAPSRSRAGDPALWIGACTFWLVLGGVLGGLERLPPNVGSGGSWGQHVPRPVPAAHEQPSARELAATLRPSVVTPLTPRTAVPVVPASAYVDPFAVLLGDVRLGDDVFIAPFVSIRADEGEPIAIGAESNVQDGAVIHGLPTAASGEPVAANRYVVDGASYSVYLAERVSIEHQAQLHGPVWIEADVWVGMQALVARARIGTGTVIEPRAAVLGVSIEPGRFVPAGVIVSRQDIADRLPEITPSYALRRRNASAVHASRALARAYARAAR